MRKRERRKRRKSKQRQILHYDWKKDETMTASPQAQGLGPLQHTTQQQPEEVARSLGGN